jgi:hypothetical protein
MSRFISLFCGQPLNIVQAMGDVIWRATLDDALVEARQRGKPLYIDFWAIG